MLIADDGTLHKPQIFPAFFVFICKLKCGNISGLYSQKWGFLRVNFQRSA